MINHRVYHHLSEWAQSEHPPAHQPHQHHDIVGLKFDSASHRTHDDLVAKSFFSLFLQSHSVCLMNRNDDYSTINGKIWLKLVWIFSHITIIPPYWRSRLYTRIFLKSLPVPCHEPNRSLSCVKNKRISVKWSGYNQMEIISWEECSFIRLSLTHEKFIYDASFSWFYTVVSG